MKYFFIILISLNCISCSDKKEQVSETLTNKSESEFVMYEMSEMASLMEAMFAENKRLRDRIMVNDTLGEMPMYFEGILSKQLTDPSDFDQFYIDHANLFLEQQKNIYANPVQAKDLFNASVDACIKCHEVKCGGPIQRIKKLYIK
jgi:hypothetical protein